MGLKGGCGKRAHLPGDDGGSDGPVVRQVGVVDGPEAAVALQAQVAGVGVGARVAEEAAELQLQVHARNLAARRLPLDRRPARMHARAYYLSRVLL